MRFKLWLYTALIVSLCLWLPGFICKSAQVAVPMVAGKTAGSCQPLLQLTDGNKVPKGQKWTIVSSELKGDKLHISGRSGGICGEHNIKVYWDGTFLESEPSQVDLYASHNGKGDDCKTMSEYKACIDVSYVSGSTVNLFNAFENKIHKTIETETIADEHKSY